MSITKAVIPAAGRGTRMQPFTHVVPKELAPLGAKPGLHFVVEEALAAGLTDIAVVVSPDKALIRQYLDVLHRDLRDDFPALRFTTILQEEPKGLAEAIALSRVFADGEPFALLLPDNILLSPQHRLGAMVDLYLEFQRDIVGVLELDHTASGRFGNCGRIEAQEIRPGVFQIEHLESKKPGRLVIPEGETLRRSCGRYLCHPEIFDDIDRIRPLVAADSSMTEYSEVPVYQDVLQRRGALGVVLPQPLFDIGNPAGYLAAAAWLHHTTR
jgi:UTP--glucose-1-phosphate uridylyltransferase